MRYLQSQTQAGLSLVEMLVVIAISVTVFTAMFTALNYSMFLIANSQARMSAMSLATDRIEYYRSLPFHDVGAVGSPVPGNGAVPNSSITTLNGIEFTEDIAVFFVNDPGDDVAGVDSNGIINDYKKVSVEIGWTVRGQTDSVEYTTNIVPVSVETAAGYGAVKIDVIDEATGLPLPGADVHITHPGDASASPAIPAQDFVVNASTNGIALVSLIAGSGYHASATDAGYSFDTTYEVTAGNPSPNPNSFTVAEALIADRPFRIGELSDLTLNVFSALSETVVTDLFADDYGLFSTSSVEVNAGQLVLENTAGVYTASGEATLDRIVPTTLERWEKVVVIGDDPVGATYNAQIYSGDCAVSCSLVSDSDLTGNSSGFTDSVIDISALDTSSYPDLSIRINLIGDTAVTPTIDEVSVYYRESSTARTSLSLPTRGDKIIGVSPDLYKYSQTWVTDSNGEVSEADLEFDQYTVDVGSLKPTTICTDIPFDELGTGLVFSHQASIDSEVDVVLESATDHTLLAIVTNASGEPLPGATVTVDNGTFSDSVVTNACGQAFINGAEDDNSYSLDVTRNGFVDDNRNGFSISGESRVRVIMNES